MRQYFHLTWFSDNRVRFVRLLAYFGALVCLFCLRGSSFVRESTASISQFSFGSPVDIVPVERSIYTLLSVDLDRNGQMDIAYGDGSHLRIAQNTVGMAGSWEITHTVGTVMGEITALSSSDLNRDGHPDLVTVAGTTIQLWGNPETAFGESWITGTSLTVTTGILQSAIAVADLDQDGAIDLITGGIDGVVRLWRNPLALQGNLTETWETIKMLPAFGGAIVDIKISDLDRDGKLDLILTSDAISPTIRLWRNPGAAFSADWVESVDFLSMHSFRSLVVADLDGDNWPDVVAGDVYGTMQGWRNPGTTPFGGVWVTELPLDSVTDGLNDLIEVDLDNDTIPELLGVMDTMPAKVVVWERVETSSGTLVIMQWNVTVIGLANSSLMSIQVADLDHDGDQDIITAGSGGIVAWTNQHGPWAVGFISGGNRIGLNDTWTMDMATVDLDRDGYLDVVTGEQYGKIVARRNDGMPFAGEWLTREIGTVPNWWLLMALSAGDVDNDGDMDLVSGYHYDHGPVIWKNNGDPFAGAWAWREIGTQRVGALALADINGDARLDIITGGGRPWDNQPSENNWVSVWYAPAAPFSDTWQMTQVGLAYYAVLGIDVGDLDNDGDIDIVIGTYHAPPVGDVDNPVPRDQWPDVYQIRAFRNDGNDQWTEFNVGRDPEIETLSIYYHGFWGATVTDVVLVDLDSDGDLDIVATERNEGDFMVMGWQNDGTPFSGELWLPSAIAKGERHYWLLTHVYWAKPGDFDLDGDIDLVSGSAVAEPYQVLVWENSGIAFGPVISETAWMRHNVGVLGEETRTGGVADFDRDGDLDLVAGTFVSTSGEIRLWENYVAPDLALGIVPAHQVVIAGQAITYTVVVTSLYGFEQPVSLWASGIPSGIETTWSLNPLIPPGQTYLTLNVPHTSLSNTYSLLATAISEDMVGQIPFTLTVLKSEYSIFLPLALREP
jgi:hypothetical protein